MMVDQTDRLSKMLNLLLDLSRVEAGRLDLHLEPTDLMLLIRRVVMSVQALSPKHSIQVHGPERVDGVWDPARLEQVLQNLLTNAIKYSPDAGNVTIQVSADADQVQVSVRDEGLGIPSEELPQVFDRFYRVARTCGLEGSGLGLYVCQGIIAAHGGRIWAASDGPGLGSAFTFSLSTNTAGSISDVA
jgi:signal transduction histidine kinase